MGKHLDAIKNDPDYRALVAAEQQRDEARAEVERLREALAGILGVRFSSTSHEITAAYKAALAALHPEKEES